MHVCGWGSDRPWAERFGCANCAMKTHERILLPDDREISVPSTGCHSQSPCRSAGDEELAAQFSSDKMDTEQPHNSHSGPNDSGDVEMGSAGDGEGEGEGVGDEKDLRASFDLPECKIQSILKGM